MIVRFYLASVVNQGAACLKWIAIVLPLAGIIGSACALFLWSLDRATALRFEHPLLLFALPVAGMAVGAVYYWTGRSTEGGNNLIVEQIHTPGAGVPLRMAPLILVSTVVTHLFGGSAGREGTAVQLGGSIASGTARLLRLPPRDVSIILMAGVAAGFGAVFGTPIAGTVFAMEVIAIGRIHYDAVLPCLFSAIVADLACRAWGIEHTAYHIAPLAAGIHQNAAFFAKIALTGLCCGLMGWVFAESSHWAQRWMKRLCPWPPLRPAVGGILVIGLVYLFGCRDYLGLGVWSPNEGDITIPSLFHADHVHLWSWLWKTLFTVVTLSSGFKGGEVTPLFFIGAALGHALSFLLTMPTDLLAGLGFVAIFAAAANTPLACTVMGIELFGATHTVPIAIACFVAYAFSSHSGIYLSQTVAIPKGGSSGFEPGIPLRQAREAKITMMSPKAAWSRLWPSAPAPEPASDETGLSG